MERLTIPEAAQRLGVSEVTVRRRIKKGELDAEKEKTAQGFEYRVLLPITLELPPHPEHDVDPPTVVVDGGREAAALRGTIAVLERELEGRNREVEHLLQLLSREQEIARAAQLALPATTEPPPTQRSTNDQSVPRQRAPSQGWWSRLLDRLGGA